MSLTLSASSLRAILALSEKRDSLLAEIKKLETEMSRIFKGDHRTSHSEKGAPSLKSSGKSAKRAKRGSVKELILAALKEAGEAGIAVKHLVARHGLKSGSVHVWLGTVGRKSGLVEALGKGVYRLKESMGATTSQNSLTAPKPKAKRKSRKIVRKAKR